MAGSEQNKVQFNLKNVHYAVMSGTPDSPAWSAPVHVPGAVTLTLDPQGDTTPFYADGMIYYNSIANNGYAGDLEMARYPDQMLAEVWGFEIGADDGILTENANTEPANFALLYQIDGDKNEDLYCLYNCSGTRPAIGGTTNTASKEPQTRSSSITAAPLEDGRVMARTTERTSDEIKKAWFTKVYEKTNATGQE